MPLRYGKITEASKNPTTIILRENLMLQSQPDYSDSTVSDVIFGMCKKCQYFQLFCPMQLADTN